jgi:hypothetical protein
VSRSGNAFHASTLLFYWAKRREIVRCVKVQCAKHRAGANGGCSFILHLFANSRLRLFAPWLSFGSLGVLSIMDSITSSPAKRDFSFLYFLAARLVGMVLVAAALPFSHTTFGENYPGDGQQAFGFIIMFMVIGFGAAFIYLFTATLIYFFIRRKSFRIRFWTEFAVLFGFILLLAYAGITAHYS